MMTMMMIMMITGATKSMKNGKMRPLADLIPLYRSTKIWNGWLCPRDNPYAKFRANSSIGACRQV